MLRHLRNKIPTHHLHPEGRLFAWLSLLNGIGNSLFLTIFPIILLNKLGSESLVGYYSAVIALVVFGASLASTIFFQRYSKVAITKVVLSVLITALVLMTLAQSIWHIGGLDIPRAICVISFGVALSLFVSDFASKANLARAEAQFYMFNNIGYLIGPVIGGYVARFAGEQFVFVAASVFYLLALAVFWHAHVCTRHPHLHHEPHKEGLVELWGNMKKYFSHPELVKVFLVALGLNFWWGVGNIYIPLEITGLGFSTDIVGWVVSATVLPLILFETLAGRHASRYGVRVCIIAGFAALTAAVASFPFLYTWPALILGAFCLVNIGAAWVEPLQETYFFNIADPKEKERYFGIYNSAQPIASVSAPLIGGTLYAIGGSLALWLGTAAILSLFVLNGLRINQNY